MERIAYEVFNSSGKSLHATFKHEAALELASQLGPGSRTQTLAVDAAAVAAKLRGKLDGLETFALEECPRLRVLEDRVLYAVVTQPGGLDGMDRSDKGGMVKFASFNRAEAMKHVNGWSRLNPRAVSTQELARIAKDARAKLTSIEALCLLGETPSPASTERLDGALAALGLEQVGGLSRSQEFHENCGALCDEMIAKIEAMMEGPVDAFHREIIYGIVERIAHAAGPQIEVSYTP